MNIVIIGTGNVATVLGKKLVSAGHHIVQVVGRNVAPAGQLATMLGSTSVNTLSAINKNAPFYLIAVNDSAIANVAKQLSLPGSIVVHTAASVSKKILKSISKQYGVFYPLQALNKEKTEIPEMPVYVDAVNEETLEILIDLGKTISENVSQASDEDRLKLHVAAVFCNNFTNHLLALAENYCKQENLNFELFKPLIKETATKVMDASPAKVQTGPAVRHDQLTIQKHLEILNAYPSTQKLYKLITESIQSHYS